MMGRNDDFYRQILDKISTGVYFVDSNRVITFWNKGAEKISGFSASEIEGKYCKDFLNHTDAEGNVLCGDKCPLLGTIQDGQPRQIEVFMQHKMGLKLPALVQSMVFDDQGNGNAGAVEIFQDISQLKAAQTQIAELSDKAYKDPLTGALNRSGLGIILPKWLEQMRYSNFHFGLLFIDIDKFKSINDTFGHHIGDEVLTAIFERLKKNLREGDLICRWGGDEFIILLQDVNENSLEKVVKKIHSFIETDPFILEPGPLQVNCSIGGSIPTQTDDPETLIERTDQQMYLAKKKSYDDCRCR